jgi:hypothetical protein
MKAQASPKRRGLFASQHGITYRKILNPQNISARYQEKSAVKSTRNQITKYKTISADPKK